MLVCGSQGKRSKELVAQYGFDYTEAPNYPLGKKWNTGLKVTEGLKWDYLLILGSDDLINIHLLERLILEAEAGHNLVGILDFYVADVEHTKAYYWPGYNGKRKGESVGAGRLIKREIIEATNYYLWTDHKNKGLDRGMYKRLQNAGGKPFNFKTLHTNCRLVDLKTKYNIGGVEKYAIARVLWKKFFTKHFSTETNQFLKSLL